MYIRLALDCKGDIMVISVLCLAVVAGNVAVWVVYLRDAAETVAMLRDLQSALSEKGLSK